MPNSPETTGRTSGRRRRPNPPAVPPSFEAALARLEAIVHELEEGRTGLADSLARYEEGVALLRHCFGVLEITERKIELLAGVDAAGNPVVEPFDDTASAERAEQGTARSRSRSAAPAKRSSPKTPAASPLPADRTPQENRPDGNLDVPNGLF